MQKADFMWLSKKRFCFLSPERAQNRSPKNAPVYLGYPALGKALQALVVKVS
jgi:hypothetical protein